MARQVLTLPDVPSTLLTKSAADGFYLPLSHAPGTDPHTQYLNNTRGDARYSLVAHNHDAAYSPAAHNHDITYVNQAGDGSIGNLGLGVTPAVWDTASFSALQVGEGGAVYGVKGLGSETLWLASNSYISPAGAGDKPLIGGRPAARIQLTGGGITLQTAPAAAAGVAHVFTPTLDINNTGNVDHHAAAADSASYKFRSADATWANIQFNRNDNVPRILFGASPTQKNFTMHTYADDGTYLGQLFNFERLTRIANFDIGVTTPYIVVNGQVRFNTTTTAGMEGPNWVFRDAQGRNRIVVWDAGNTSFSGDISAANVSASASLIASQNCYVTNEMAAGYGTGVHCYMRPSGVYNGGGNLNLQSGNSVVLVPNNNAAGGYVHPGSDNYVYLGHPGLRWIAGYFVSITTNDLNANSQVYCPGASIISGSTGGQYIQTNYHQFVKGGGGHIQVAGAGNFEPATDNSCLLGGSVNRWQSVWSNNGGIQTSHVSMKKNFVPLDPGECAAAVLSTDWIHFEYLEPEMQPAAKMETPDQRKGRYEDFARLLVETAPARNQKGYVLESPNHNTHALFGLNDRRSSSPSSDLAVVAAALQFALREIAQLKEELAARG